MDFCTDRSAKLGKRLAGGHIGVFAHDFILPTPELVLWRVDEWCCELWSEAGRSRCPTLYGHDARR